MLRQMQKAETAKVKRKVDLSSFNGAQTDQEADLRELRQSQFQVKQCLLIP